MARGSTDELEAKERAPLSPAQDRAPEGLTLSLPEVKQIWSFLDGAIMDVQTRHHLWKSWGLCLRHAWCYAVAEIEIRGGQPFSTSILYEDLIGRAARVFSGTKLVPWRVLVGRLQPHAPCFTCEYVSGWSGGWRDDDSRERQERVNTLQRTRPLLEEHRRLWRDKACPHCLAGRGIVCRQHLLAGAEANLERGELGDALARLKGRLHTFVKSMTVDGKPATPEESVSWVEALCWFTGWNYPGQILAGVGRGAAPSRGPWEGSS